MLIVISPAKRIKFTEKPHIAKFTIPEKLDKSEKLVKRLRNFSAKKLQGIMNINPSLAHENVERFLQWNKNFNLSTARQSILSFSGDVFLGIDAKTLDEPTLEFAQEHLRILSGLHGYLRPLDLIMPYRLEMGQKLQTGKHNDLYSFWGNDITNHLMDQLKKINGNTLINLASIEYFKSIKTSLLKNIRILDLDFREYKNGEYKFVHVFGKKARGYMCRYILEKKIEDPEQIKLFDIDGYEYNDRLSNNNKWVFTRG